MIDGLILPEPVTFLRFNMITLDMKTVMIGNAVTNFVCLIVLLMLWYQTRNRYSGIIYWVIVWVLQTGSAILIALRDVLPDWVSVVLSNSMLGCGTIILYYGLCRFTGKRLTPIFMYSISVLFAIFIFIHIFFVFIQNDLMIRNYNISIGLSITCLVCMWLMFKGVTPEIRRITKYTGISFTIIFIINLMRIVEFSLLGQNTNEFLQSGKFDTLLVLLLVGASIFLVFNLILMVNRRLYIESEQMKDAAIKGAEERLEWERKAQNVSRLATIGEMAAGMAHEINNPLSGVVGFSELLLKRNIPEDIKKDISIINEGSRRIANIVGRMLLFARKAEPKRTIVNINDTIEITLAIRAYEMESSNIKIITNFDPDLPLIYADAGLLQQVFLNIVLNAETAMKLAHGKGNLTVKTERINDIIRASFEDDGPGISKENMEKIFNPFFTTREPGQGTGLGLSVSLGIVTQHGGKIYARSELGKGAIFFIELPIVHRSEQLKQDEPVAGAHKNAIKSRILVVDDEPLVQQFLTAALTEEGHEVEIVDNGNDALEKLGNREYDVILLDVKLPGMDGIEIYKQLQKNSKSLVRKVIFITGDVLEKDIISFLSSSKPAYITKPFGVAQLVNEIGRIISNPKLR